ncbi:MAG TPA: HAMP domain-containing sensor histidine kinase [Polyangiales bacterium]|nr:HAMP domain-containing sensor histidine kinase [Polyangiales bacterium]
MARISPAIDRTSFRQNASERALSRLARVRVYVAPVIACVAALFAFFEPVAWRKAVLFPAVGVLFLLSYIEWVRIRAYGVRALSMPLNMGVMLLGQIALAFATGGLFSPVIAGLVLVATLASVFAEGRVVFFFIECLEVPAVWCMAYVHKFGWPVPTLIPELFGDAGTLEHGVAPWVLAALYTIMLNAAARLGMTLREVFAELFDEAIAARDRALAMNSEQARALTTLSAELAHELKNPLASVKGLSALVARDVQGKSADRLQVLRGEVDRMQGILDEFLDFSRPLVPLAMEDVELGELAHQVLRLYEATAADCGVQLQLSAGDVRLRCDPRKVRQILINLIQNALDASQRGGAVEIEVLETAGSAQLRVADRGAGINPEIAASLFEPGVTTKEHGSGIGLVVARSLARQHSGELTLLARAGGGAVAELTLPLQAASVPPLESGVQAKPQISVPAKPVREAQ